jgi:hypothetical protein
MESIHTLYLLTLLRMKFVIKLGDLLICLNKFVCNISQCVLCNFLYGYDTAWYKVHHSYTFFITHNLYTLQWNTSCAHYSETQAVHTTVKHKLCTLQWNTSCANAIVLSLKSNIFPIEKIRPDNVKIAVYDGKRETMKCTLIKKSNLLTFKMVSTFNIWFKLKKKLLDIYTHEQTLTKLSNGIS